MPKDAQLAWLQQGPGNSGLAAVRVSQGQGLKRKHFCVALEPKSTPKVALLGSLPATTFSTYIRKVVPLMALPSLLQPKTRSCTNSSPLNTFSSLSSLLSYNIHCLIISLSTSTTHRLNCSPRLGSSSLLPKARHAACWIPATCSQPQATRPLLQFSTSTPYLTLTLPYLTLRYATALCCLRRCICTLPRYSAVPLHPGQVKTVD